MSTKEYRTKQEFVDKIGPKGKNFIIGLDAGYSGMKVYHELGYFVFPSYAKHLQENLLVSDSNDILYKDLQSNETYLVGINAGNMVKSSDTNDTDAELYSRNRYGNKMFKILCNTAIGIALSKRADNDNREIFIETGLPCSYVTGDSSKLKNTLKTPAHFALKVGKGSWREYKFEVKEDHIHILPQPMGSFYSVLAKSNGEFVPNAQELMAKNIFIADIGYGTADLYGIISRAKACSETINDLGMREVMLHTSRKIMEQMHEDIKPNALQKSLETGKVLCLNEETMQAEEKEFGSLLVEASNEVMREAIETIKHAAGYFRDYDLFIVSGGTGACWYEAIRNYFSGLKTLTVMSGNPNEVVPGIFSNVRGYYFFRYMQNKR